MEAPSPSTCSAAALQCQCTGPPPSEELPEDRRSTNKKHKLDIKGASRDKSTEHYEAFIRDRALLEASKLKERLPTGAVVRVVCVRHGMGHHNDGFELASFMNRDAELNRIGFEQARQTGELLRAHGAFRSKFVAVVSPMRRTLQTALGVFGGDQWEAHTIVHPLAAETSIGSRLRGAPGFFKKALTTVQQGDRGSTPAELRSLFPPERHPQLDFSTVERYCELMGPRWATGGVDEGKWWHHGTGDGMESDGQAAAARGASLRRLIAEQAQAHGVQTVVLVSHGGILKLTFATDSFANAEFRCFELSAAGEVVGRPE